MGERGCSLCQNKFPHTPISSQEDRPPIASHGLGCCVCSVRRPAKTPAAKTPVGLRRDNDLGDLVTLTTVLINLYHAGVAHAGQTGIETAIENITARIAADSVNV